MLEAVDAATPDLNLNVLREYMYASIGSSVVTWKKVSALNIFGQITWKALRQAFSGFMFLSKQIGHQHQPVRLGKLKMPGFLAFCDPRAV